MNIIYFDELESTNSHSADNRYAHGTIVVAHNQTAGRGQRGNTWETKQGQNLTFSLTITPTHIPVVEQYRISMIAALAACDAICDAGLECQIKWPNDLYVKDSKIGGILIENSLMGEMLTRSIVGIGINVRQRDFPSSLPNPTSMVNSGACNATNEALLELFVHHFEWRYAQSTRELHHDFMARLWRRESEHLFADSNGEFRAAISRVDPLTGQLTLTTTQGDERHYWFKEVEFLRNNLSSR